MVDGGCCGGLLSKGSILVSSSTSATFALNHRPPLLALQQYLVPPQQQRIPYHSIATIGNCGRTSSSNRRIRCLGNSSSSSFPVISHHHNSYFHPSNLSMTNAKTSMGMGFECFSTTTSTTTAAQHPPERQQDEVVVVDEKIKEAANTLDIRVGKILIAYKHPEADSLYVEEVDVGEPQPRIICSGLVDYIPINDLMHLKVVVLANLKPRNMRGVRSFGMLLAASDAEHENVELLMPPENSIPGERIWFGSMDENIEKDSLPDVASPNQIQKKKIWELVQPHLKTDDSCIAALGLHAMRTLDGVVITKSLKNARIS